MTYKLLFGTAATTMWSRILYPTRGMSRPASALLRCALAFCLADTYYTEVQKHPGIYRRLQSQSYKHRGCVQVYLHLTMMAHCPNL